MFLWPPKHYFGQHFFYWQVQSTQKVLAESCSNACISVGMAMGRGRGRGFRLRHTQTWTHLAFALTHTRPSPDPWQVLWLSYQTHPMTVTDWVGFVSGWFDFFYFFWEKWKIKCVSEDLNPWYLGKCHSLLPPTQMTFHMQNLSSV